MLRRRLSFVLVLVLLVLAWALPTLIQAAPATPTPNEVNAVARDLWCPLCNGVRLDNCDLQACVQMKQVIAQKLTEGESKEQIRTYFVQQYGDVVTGVPARQGFNLVAWYLPVVATVVGLAILSYLVYTYIRRRPAPDAATTGESSSGAANKDEYLRRVDEELKKYD